MNILKNLGFIKKDVVIEEPTPQKAVIITYERKIRTN